MVATRLSSSSTTKGRTFNAGSNAVTTGVPTDLEKTGDFSQTLNQPGTAMVRIADPLTGVMTANGVMRTPFQDDRIPGGRIDNLAKIYLGLYPGGQPRTLAGHHPRWNWIGSQTNTNSLALLDRKIGRKLECQK